MGVNGLKNNILRNIIISVISALLILIIILAFFQFIVKEPRSTSYIIEEIFGSGARGALIIIAVTVGINMVCLTVVDISNLESEKSRIKYEAYMKKQEEERDKEKARAEAKATPKQVIDGRPKREISRQDRTDDYLAQQLAAVYEQRKKG